MNNFSQVLYKFSREIPDRAAIHLLYSRQPTETFTYRELLHHSLRYAIALEKAGIQPGEVVILILQHGSDLVSAFFGAILRGAIPSIMPFLTEKLHPDQYRASLAALFKITAPAAVITYPEFVHEAEASRTGSSVRCVLSTNQVQQLSAEPIPSEAIQPENVAGLQRSPDDIVLLQHSSGTTGLQKGVALSHKAVFHQLEAYSRALHLTSSDVIVSWLPLYHDMGLIAGFIMPILSGIPLVLLSPFDWVRAPHRLLKAVSEYRGTLCWLPNFAYNFCAQKIRDQDLAGVDLSSLRAVINCSEPMHWKSHAMFLERFRPYGFRSEALATSYAMAENVFAVTQGGIDEPVRVDLIEREAFQTQQYAKPIKSLLGESGLTAEASPGPEAIRVLSAGRPIEGTKVRVLDSSGKDLPERLVGEIALKSNCMLSGYYRRPDLTDKAFLDGWYLTGDLGYLANGELYVTGRKKDLIIVGGKNIYPQDLEQLAGEVEGIHPGRVVAFGVFNEESGTEDVVIVAEVDLSEEEGQESAIEAEKERLANQVRQKVNLGSDIAVRRVYLVNRNWLIKTSSGKIARSANRAKFLAETAQNP